MQVPLQISFRHVPRSVAVEDLIRQCAQRLEGFYERITSCRVVVDQPHRRHREGNDYQVRIDITVPGEEIVINREPRQPVADRQLVTAVADAFDQALRRVREFVQRQRRDVKVHQPALHARVTEQEREQIA